MAQRALVIGSQTNLRGPKGDAERTAAALTGLGFAVDVRTADADTSRLAILDGYARLISASSAGDAAVIYYSGHGARVFPAAGSELPAAANRPTHSIVPSDYLQSTPDDFRGITDVELSVLQARLTERTANTTVILDCCYATSTSRAYAVSKSILPVHIDMHRHIARAVEAGLRVDTLDPAGNQKAVRLVACGQSQVAFEQPVDGEPRGIFTEALLEAVTRARGQRVSWASLMIQIREKVIAMNGAQRPEVEGPGRRYLFDLAEAPQLGAVALAYGPANQPILRAGRLHGVHRGDEYVVVPIDAPLDVDARIGIATVQTVDWSWSEVALQDVPPAHVRIPAQALPVSSAAPQRAVRVIGDDPARAQVAQAIAASPRFLVVGETSDLAILATVRARGSVVELHGPGGIDLVPPVALTEASLRDLVANLTTLSAARALHELPASNQELPASAVEISWGRVEDGKEMLLPDAGAVISVGDRLFVRVKNTHPMKRKLFVHLLNIGTAQRIDRVTKSWGPGFELGHGETFTAGQNNYGALTGLVTSWPPQLPRDMRRPESLVVIVTEEQADLSQLEQPGMKADWTIKGPIRNQPRDAGMIQLMRHALSGETRDAGYADQNPGYLVHRIHFDMQPWPMSGGPSRV